MKRYLFVGEQRSPTAVRQGWTWESGRLCASTLFAALRAAGVDPERQLYRNLYPDAPAPPVLWRPTVVALAAAARVGWQIVALGSMVSGDLARYGIPHITLIHPAARGAIRKRERYIAHVREVLSAS